VHIVIGEKMEGEKIEYDISLRRRCKSEKFNAIMVKIKSS
jgi:hypothetical protein